MFRKGKHNAEKRGPLTRDEAERIAIGGLAFLADRPEALARFLSLAGIGPASLRSAAADPDFLAGVIDHFLGHDALLVEYARSAGIAPERVAGARRLLGGD
jgi:hypothetical protein